MLRARDVIIILLSKHQLIMKQRSKQNELKMSLSLSHGELKMSLFFLSHGELKMSLFSLARRDYCF